MNSRLRRRHRRTVSTLAVLIPVGLAAALSARVQIAADPDAGHPARVIQVSGRGRNISARLEHPQLSCHVWLGTDERPPVVELLAHAPLAQPDLLVYWGPGTSPLEHLAGNEYLLGSFTDRRRTRVVLPPEAKGESEVLGRVLLYSLAHDEVLVAATLEGTEDEP